MSSSSSNTNSKDENLRIFKKIKSFVSELQNITSIQSVKNYFLFLDKTPDNHSKGVAKQVSIFRDWILANEKAITQADVKLLSENPIEYNKDIQIPLKSIALENESSIQEVILKHLQLILFLFNPSEELNLVISSQKSKVKNEENFLNSFMNKIEQSFSNTEFTDPMQATTQLMSSNIFGDLVSSLEQGVNDGSLDLMSLMGTVQGMMGALKSEDPTAAASIDSMMGSLMGGGFPFGPSGDEKKN
jgi:hypothetical protein